MSNNLIALDSDEGRKLLAAAEDQASSQYALYEPHYKKQIGRSFCGVASIAMAYSALGQTLTEAMVFQSPGLDAQTLGVTHDTVTQRGMTLPELIELAQALGKPSYAIHGETLDVEELRQKVKNILRSNDTVCLGNYYMSAIGQIPFKGHFSPLVAYEATSDRILILDTWPETESTWVTCEELLNATKGVDSDSGKSRGLAILGNMKVLDRER
jgi:hypothetical protein